MARIQTLSVAFAVIFGVANASLVRADVTTESERHEKVVKAMIKGLDDLTAALKSIKDDATATAGAKKINEVCDRFDKLAEEARKLPKLSREVDAQLQKKYAEDLKKSVVNLQQAAPNVAQFAKTNPKLVEAAKRMITVGDKLKAIGGGGS